MVDFCIMKMIGTILMVAVGFMFDSKVDITKSDSLSARQTVEVINEAKGIVYKISDETYMIECAEKHVKLNVFNLPEAFKKDNAAIIFSGNIKLSEPMEDEWGEVFEITNVKL